MTVHEFMTRNINRIRVMYRNGLFPISDMNYFDIYNRMLTIEGRNKTYKIISVSIEMNIGVRTVFRAVKRMESDFINQ